MRPAKWQRAAPFLWAIGVAVLCALSLASGDSALLELTGRVPVGDGTGHLIAYACLSLLPLLGFVEDRTAWTLSSSMAPLGLILELAQIGIPGRALDWADLAANSGGVVLGILLGWRLRRIAGSGASP